MGMVVKDTAAVARKYVQRATAAAPQYAEGVQAPTADWAQQTEAAGDSYEQGVTAAIGRKAFQKGIRAAGTPKWQEKARTMGAARYGQGVGGAEAAYAAGVDPYLATLRGVTLGPRGPRGSPQNLNRVQAVTDALHRKKTG